MSEINDIEEQHKVNFPINLKLIQRYHWGRPIIIAKYKNGTCHKGYFRGVSNIDLNPIRDSDALPIFGITYCSYTVFIFNKGLSEIVTNKF